MGVQLRAGPGPGVQAAALSEARGVTRAYSHRTITLFEAQARTGINRRQLRKAIDAGKLQGRLEHGGGEVRVASLRRFVDSLPVRTTGEAERRSKITIPERCHPF